MTFLFLFFFLFLQLKCSPLRTRSNILSFSSLFFQTRLVPFCSILSLVFFFLALILSYLSVTLSLQTTLSLSSLIRLGLAINLNLCQQLERSLGKHKFRLILLMVMVSSFSSLLPSLIPFYSFDMSRSPFPFSSFSSSSSLAILSTTILYNQNNKYCRKIICYIRPKQQSTNPALGVSWILVSIDIYRNLLNNLVTLTKRT